MILVVTGSRTFHDFDALFSVLNYAHSVDPIQHLFVGDANGADSHAKDWADQYDVPCSVFVADWNKYGRSAGPKRNGAMLDAAVNYVREHKAGPLHVAAFTDKDLNDSRGTANCVAGAVQSTVATVVHFKVQYGKITRTVIREGI